MAVLLLAAPALASCGFDYATDRVNTIAPGANDRSGDVKVLGAVVIADGDGSGVFVATFANSGSDADSLDNLTGETDESGASTLNVAGETAAVDIPAGGRVSLIEQGGVPVQGEFELGDFVPVTLTFGSGQVTTIETNVVRPCHQYSPEKLGELSFPESTSTGESDERYSCDIVESEVWPEGEEPHHGGGEH